MKKLVASRRFLLWVCGGVLLLVGVYVWWSVTTWNGYSKRFTDAEKEDTAKIQMVIDMKTDTKDQRVAKLTALYEVTNQLPLDESLCEVNGLIGWQRVLGDLKTQESTCKEKQGRLIALRHSLNKVVNYLKAEHALANLLSAAPAGGELAEAAWAQQRDGWTELLKNIESLKSDNEFDSVRLAAKNAVEGIVAAWNELLAAHQAKDKNRYINASTALLGSYEGLQAVSKVDTEKFKTLLYDFEGIYSQLPPV